jgi:outer membrane protein TolC
MRFPRFCPCASETTEPLSTDAGRLGSALRSFCPDSAWPLEARACDIISDPVTVVECALAKSPELRNEQQEVQVLRGQRVRAQSLLPAHPTVQVSFAGRRPPTSGTSGAGQTTFNWYVALAQEFEIAGQRSARVRAADAAIAAQQRRALVTAQEVASAALGTYYDALASAETLTLGREVAAIAEQLATVGAARSQAALASPCGCPGRASRVRTSLHAPL